MFRIHCTCQNNYLRNILFHDHNTNKILSCPRNKNIKSVTDGCSAWVAISQGNLRSITLQWICNYCYLLWQVKRDNINVERQCQCLTWTRKRQWWKTMSVHSSRNFHYTFVRYISYNIPMVKTCTHKESSQI